MTRRTKREDEPPAWVKQAFDHPAPASAAERLQWLLDFVRTDLARRLPGEVEAEGTHAVRHLLAGDAGPGVVEIEHDIADPLPLLAELQRGLGVGLRAMSDGVLWRPFAVGRAPDWVIVPGSTPQRQFWGRLDNALLASAVDLLTQHWSQLRVCALESCGVLFLPTHGRQRFHTPKCSAAERARRHAPKRDYVREEQRRAERDRERERRRKRFQQRRPR